MVEITLKLPDSVARRLGVAPGEIPRHLLEVIALDGYRRDQLDKAQVGQLLQLNPLETDRFLALPPNNGRSAPDQDMAAFREALPGLLRTDPGSFVAISERRVIDRDPDELTLAVRVSREHPGQRILIQPVTDRGLEEIHIETPELETPRKGGA